MNEWEQTLFKSIGISRISRMIPNIADTGPSPVKGTLLGGLLPSLHYLTLVAILDEAYLEYIEENNIPWPKKTKHDLFNRIKIISNIFPMISESVFQQIRERRNSIAHDPDLIFSSPVTWDELDETITHICNAMKELGLISFNPQIEAYSKRIPELFPNELGPDGERMRHKHIIGAKINDEMLMEYSHVISYFPPGNP